MKFVLETDVFKEGLEDIVDAIIKLGHEHRFVQYTPFAEQLNYSYSIFIEEEPVLFYGSLNLAGRVRRNCRWVPGLYCDLDKLKCSNYYTYLGKFLLNKDYSMMPLRELDRRMEELFDLYGTNDTIYIRPDKGIKEFTGQTLNFDSFEHQLNRISWSNTDATTMVVVSSPKNIKYEYRVVIVDKKPVAASLYKNRGRFEKQEGCPTEILRFAEHIAETYSPENAFVADICYTDEGIFLVELNSFSCSGFYDANKLDIIRAIAECSLKDWGELYGYE